MNVIKLLDGHQMLYADDCSTFYILSFAFILMELRDIGEREAIKIMAELYGSVNLDDCATIEVGNEFFLVTTDMVNEKTHFPDGATPYQIGWFVVAINLSDIAAKGGIPVGVTLSLGLPANKDVDFIKEFSRGADDCAKKFGTKIIGGDTRRRCGLRDRRAGNGWRRT